MKKILISRCLLGERVRFDGQKKAIADERIFQWLQEGRLLPICPEVAGGLSTPRSAAEIQRNGQVKTVCGGDVSPAFQLGAQAALKLAQLHQCQLALLKARSPSCGSGQTYDGSFSQVLLERDGITCELLKKNGILVFNEEQIDELLQCL